jgi:hypothetical protein
MKSVDSNVKVDILTQTEYNSRFSCILGVVLDI